MVGDGSALTPDQIDAFGKLQATIDNVTVSSPPVVDFTVLDKNGDPALGLDASTVRFTIAKLVPNTAPDVNGGLPYWQNYIYTSEDPDQPDGPGVLAFGGRAGTESGGALVDNGDGTYQYTFATDVTNVTAPIAVPWEPNLTHRVGMEIRLSSASGARRPMAPDNPIYDYVPDGGVGSGTKLIADTDNCEGCHLEFAFHGGQRKTVEYCVTCHNHGMVDADSGNSLDFAHMLHSVHMGSDRPVPYIIYRRFGGNNRTFDFSEVHFPQSQTFCESCHEGSASHPDGDNWNTVANVKTCGGCHADGVVTPSFDAVTGVAQYQFNHTAAGADIDPGVVSDGACGGCHLGQISSAGPPLSIHSRISGDQRFRKELGEDFIFEILDATNTGPGQTPQITFRVTNAAGTPYDIVNDPEFDPANGASLNLYVAWSTDDIYNGDEGGATLGLRDRNRDTTVPPDGIPDAEPYGPGHPHRMYLQALQRDIVANPGWANPDGSYTVTYFTSLPVNIRGDAMISLGGHPAAVGVADADGVVGNQRAAATSTVFFPGAPRQLALDTDKCNQCHNQLQFHGANRNGNAAICLNCHNADLARGGEGFAFGRMIHAIHSGSTTFNEGEFSYVHFPQNVANCDACHVEGSYTVARTSARAVSIDGGADGTIWSDDFATTPNSAACGACHNDIASQGHFSSQAGQLGVLKTDIVMVDGLPNGQEACSVCHGPGSEFDSTQYHNPGIE